MNTSLANKPETSNRRSDQSNISKEGSNLSKEEIVYVVSNALRSAVIETHQNAQPARTNQLGKNWTSRVFDESERLKSRENFKQWKTMLEQELKANYLDMIF